MMGLSISQHANERMPQRHFGEIDIALWERFGTSTDDGIIWDRRASARAADHFKRLEDTMVVIANGNVVTAQRLTRAKAKRKRQAAERDD